MQTNVGPVKFALDDAVTWCAYINAPAYRSTGRDQPCRHRESLTSLQFDVICCTFIYGCEQRVFMYKIVINNRV